jgi:hypothetical protein
VNRLACGVLLAFSGSIAGQEHPCSNLSKNDEWKVHLLLEWSSPYRSRREELADDTSKSTFSKSQYEDPRAVARCLWQTVKQCDGSTASPLCKQARSVTRPTMALRQLQVLEPPCQNLKIAESIRAEATDRHLRARLCIFSVLSGGPIDCLNDEKRDINKEYRRPTDMDSRNPHWLWSLLNAAPESRFSRLLPWLESLPSVSSNQRFVRLRRLALAVHHKDYDGLFSEIASAAPDNPAIGWAMLYFPEQDWEGRVNSVRLPEKRRKELLELIQSARKQSPMTSLVRAIDAGYCNTDRESGVVAH